MRQRKSRHPARRYINATVWSASTNSPETRVFRPRFRIQVALIHHIISIMSAGTGPPDMSARYSPSMLSSKDGAGRLCSSPLTSNSASLLGPPSSPSSYASKPSDVKSSRSIFPRHMANVNSDDDDRTSVSVSSHAESSKRDKHDRFCSKVLGPKRAGIRKGRKQQRIPKICLEGRESHEIFEGWESDNISPTSSDAESGLDDSSDIEMKDHEADHDGRPKLDIDAGPVAEKVLPSFANLAFKETGV